MEIAGNILSMLFLSVMSWQDFHSRRITAWILPAIGLCFLLGEISVLTVEQLINNAKVNYTLLVLQFTLLWIWISLRNRKIINIINTQIGLGDILLLFCLAPAFSPFNFFFFYTTGVLLAIAIYLGIRLLTNNINPKIPLAGVLGLPLILVCGLRLIAPNFIVTTSDDWLTGMILP